LHAQYVACGDASSIELAVLMASRRGVRLDRADRRPDASVADTGW
jgi:hypothetical protein